MSRPSLKRPSPKGATPKRASFKQAQEAKSKKLLPSRSPSLPRGVFRWVRVGIAVNFALGYRSVLRRRRSRLRDRGRLDAGLACGAGAAGCSASDGRSRRGAERTCCRGRSQGGQACRRSGHGGRIDALEKSATSLRSDIASLRAQSDKTASALNDARSAPRAAAPDLAALNDRLAQLERASKTERAELAQQSEKIAAAKATDDKPLRHVVAAALLDVAVRHGDAYESQLAAARSLAAKPDMLKPLDTFASSGIPTPVALSRELLNIVPKLSPPAEAPASGTGIVERLQAGASKLVRIERTDGVGNDRGAIVARVTAAALRNDFVEARRELKTLPEADRAPAQAWLDKADARDAALAASRKFADAAMADLVKPGQ